MDISAPYAHLTNAEFLRFAESQISDNSTDLERALVARLAFVLETWADVGSASTVWHTRPID